MIARNVVQLAGAQINSRTTHLVADIPETISLSKQIATKRLRELLSKMFDNVDDSLFEYADKASSNQQQMHYFDAMRELRIQKTNMIKVFFKEFENQFEDIVHGNIKSDNFDIKSDSGLYSLSNLSLVGEEELEIDLAITNMVEKIQSNYRENLIALARRTDHALGVIGITTENQPLGAKALCNSIASSIETLSMEIEIKLIVFKLFDKYIIQFLNDIYTDINHMFIDNGVLPHIKLKLPAHSSDGVHNPSHSPMQEYGPHANEEQHFDAGQSRYDEIASGMSDESLEASTFDVIQQLMSRSRVTTGEVPASVAGTSAGLYPSTPGVRTNGTTGGLTNIPSNNGQDITGTFPVSDVVSGLSLLQQNAGQVIDVTNGASTQGATGEVLKLNLVEALYKNDPDNGSSKVIDDAEADAIDIVSMLFDFILEDKALPDRLKTLIAKLQIPFVKLAIVDKSFFAKKSHPARLLLNELAYAASGSEDGVDVEDDSLFEAMETIVNRISTDFELEITIFEQLLDEFRDFCERESEANRLAQEMLEKAKETVASEIEHRVVNNRMPDYVKELLRSRWKDVMTTIGVRDSCEGIAWDAVIVVMDDLIWSIQPKLVVQEQAQLTGLIPKILNGLQDGLILTGTSQQEIYDIFGNLEELHHASLKGLREVDLQRHTDDMGNDQEDSMLEIVLESEESDNEYSDPRNDLMHSKFYYLVKSMEQGTWVKFTTDDGERQGRLAWKCDFTGDYTFVNRRYQLVMDINLYDLVTCFDEQKAELIDELPLFDRAVNAVVNGLKQCLSDDKSGKEGMVD